MDSNIPPSYDEDAIIKIAKRMKCAPYLDTILNVMVDRIETLEKEVEKQQEFLDRPDAGSFHLTTK